MLLLFFLVSIISHTRKFNIIMIFIQILHLGSEQKHSNYDKTLRISVNTFASFILF